MLREARAAASLNHPSICTIYEVGEADGHYFIAIRRMAPETSAECGKLMQLLAGAYVMRPIAQCAWAYAAVEEAREARRLLQIVEHPPAGRWLDPAMMGQAYGELGEIDRAIEWYKQGLEERSPSMIYMKAGVQWGAVREDPRFQTMLRQMKFPQ